VTAPVVLSEEKTPNVNRECPAWIVRELKKIGGLNAKKQPNFRVVWGGSRTDIGADGSSAIRPYRTDMWHLEKFKEETGEYEHAIRLGMCPYPLHRKTGLDRFCTECFHNGGVPLEPDQSFSIIEAYVRMLLKADTLQREARFKGRALEQKNALFGREEKKTRDRAEKIYEAYEDAKPKTVKRSYEAPMHVTAEETFFGNRRGLYQMTDKQTTKGTKNGNDK
jgi:hypothetical protein